MYRLRNRRGPRRGRDEDSATAMDDARQRNRARQALRGSARGRPANVPRKRRRGCAGPPPVEPRHLTPPAPTPSACNPTAGAGRPTRTRPRSHGVPQVVQDPPRQGLETRGEVFGALPTDDGRGQGVQCGATPRPARPAASCAWPRPQDPRCTVPRPPRTPRPAAQPLSHRQPPQWLHRAPRRLPAHQHQTPHRRPKPSSRGPAPAHRYPAPSRKPSTRPCACTRGARRAGGGAGGATSIVP